MARTETPVWSWLARVAAALFTLGVVVGGLALVRSNEGAEGPSEASTIQSRGSDIMDASPRHGTTSEPAQDAPGVLPTPTIAISPTNPSGVSTNHETHTETGDEVVENSVSTAPITTENPPTETTASAVTSPTSSVVTTAGTTGTTAPAGFDRIIDSATAAITVPAGEHWRIRGPSLGGPAQLTLTADVQVMGRLSLDKDVTIDGRNRFGIHAHSGGALDFQGESQSAWVRWGDTPGGWKQGDRLVVSPTAAGAVGSGGETTWGGSWATTIRPGGSADVLLNGETLRPEVANLSQSITLRGITRIMIHESGGVPTVQTLKHFRCIDCGVTDTLGMYPIHFHLVGSTARGSIVEGVVIDSGNFRAFVPHGSNGITFRDTVAYNTTRSAYWWDSNSNPKDPGGHNASSSILWDHALAFGVSGTRSDLSEFHLTAGFVLGSGSGNVLRDSVAVGVDGGQNAAGFLWPEHDHAVWGFSENLAHNNRNGIYVWQNDDMAHVIDRYDSYRNADSDIKHGAYKNSYRYVDVSAERIRSLAQSASGARQRWDRLRTAEFHIAEHTLSPDHPIEIADCQIGRVIVNQTGSQHGWYHFINCGLKPESFTFTQIHPGTLIEISEGGVLTHRWAGGTWSR